MRYTLLLVGLLACSVLAASMTSCVVAHGNGTSWTYAGLGADADGLDIKGAGMTAQKIETSKALIATLQEVRKMWSSYLIQQGLQYVAGKYYGLEGRKVDAATTTKLEELRNAKSVADANAKLAELKVTTAAAPAAAATP